MANPKRQLFCSRVSRWKTETSMRTILLSLILIVNIHPSLLLKLSSSTQSSHESKSKGNMDPMQIQRDNEILTASTPTVAISSVPSKIRYVPQSFSEEGYKKSGGKSDISNFPSRNNIQHNHNEKRDGGKDVLGDSSLVMMMTGSINEEDDDSAELSLQQTKPTKILTTFDLISTKTSSLTSSSLGIRRGQEQLRSTRSLKNNTFASTKKVVSHGGILNSVRSQSLDEDGDDDDDDKFYGQVLEDADEKEKNDIKEKVATQEEKEAIESFQGAFVNGKDVSVSEAMAFSKMDMGILEKFSEKEKFSSSSPLSKGENEYKKNNNVGEETLRQLSFPVELQGDASNDIKMQKLKNSTSITVMSTMSDNIVAVAASKSIKVDGEEEVKDEHESGESPVVNRSNDGDDGGEAETQEEFDESAEGAPEGIDSLENSSSFYYYYTSKHNTKNKEREQHENRLLNQTSSSRLTFANSAKFDKGAGRRKNVGLNPDIRDSAASTTSADEVKLYRLVQRLLKESPLIDGHNDLPWNLRKFLHGQLLEFDFNSDLRSIPPWSNSAWSHTDLPRLRRGLVGAQFWVAYAPCESQNLNAVQITLEQIDLIRRLIARYPENLTLALSADDIEMAHKKGKIASLIAVEGGHCIGSSLSTLRSFYELGVRYMTLTHNCNTPWADSARPGHKPEHGGLTEFGRAVVREMNRIGMLIDLSHTSKLTMKDALKVSKAPVIFSHSSAYALCNSSRNVPDDILKELVWNRGIIMVTFYNIYVKCHMQASVRDVADHINYIRGKIGLEHLGIGSDYDGINLTPVGLEDVSKFPNLFVELARSPNWSNDEIKMVAGRNFLRVFREAENVRDAMRSSGVPASFEVIPPRDITDSIRCRLNTTSSSSIH